MSFYIKFGIEVVHIWEFKCTKFGVISITFRYPNDATNMAFQIWKFAVQVVKLTDFELLYLDTQDSEISSVCRVWNLVWNSYCFTNFRSWFTFCKLRRISKDDCKTKTGSNLSYWNWNFELKNECLPFRILEKYLLGIFSTSNLISNGKKFSIFGPTECNIRFF